MHSWHGFYSRGMDQIQEKSVCVLNGRYIFDARMPKKVARVVEIPTNQVLIEKISTASDRASIEWVGSSTESRSD
jgi:hypothetical protein